MDGKPVRTEGNVMAGGTFSVVCCSARGPSKEASEKYFSGGKRMDAVGVVNDAKQTF